MCMSCCEGPFSDRTHKATMPGVVCGFSMTWGAAGKSSYVDGVVTCGVPAFRGEGAGAGAAINDHAQRWQGEIARGKLWLPMHTTYLWNWECHKYYRKL